MNIFSPITFQIDFTGFTENLYVVKENNIVGHYDMTNHIPRENNYTFYLTDISTQSIEIIASKSSFNSQKVTNYFIA